VTSAYEQNRRNLNNTRFTDPTRFQQQLKTGKEFITETAKELTKPESIQEILLDMVYDAGIFVRSDNPISAIQMIAARRTGKFVFKKVNTELNDLVKIGQRLERQVPNFKTADSGVVQFLDSTNVNDIFVQNSTTLNAANEMLGYTRPDAVRNLQLAGLNPPKGGGLYGRKRTRRTLQGPVPPQLPDKTTIANSYEEAIMLGTTKFEEGGVVKQIRNYASDTAPHGRVTKVDVRKMTGRGTEGRLTYEKLLTLDKNATGFYGVKIKGKEHAHHWNPIGVMKRIVEDLDPKLRTKLLNEAQDEFGLYSGNAMFNLRQLPTEIHDKLHKALNKAGYDPKKMQSFAKADYATRKAYLKEFSDVLNELDKQVFEEVMIKTHGTKWKSKFKGLQIE
jgi:hypothetical protein